jgi:CheY-like chemotaxis protein
MVTMQCDLEPLSLMDRNQGRLLRGGNASAGREEAASQTAISSGRRSKGGQGMRALVVDDDVTTRRLHRRVLNIFQIRNVMADDGLEGVAMVMQAADTGDPFDLIVTDLQMPIVDGWGLAATVRGQGFSGTIIAVSGCADSDAEQRCLAGGFDAYLPKPVSVHELMATINRSVALRDYRSDDRTFAIAV